MSEHKATRRSFQPSNAPQVLPYTVPGHVCLLGDEQRHVLPRSSYAAAASSSLGWNASNRTSCLGALRTPDKFLSALKVLLCSHGCRGRGKEDDLRHVTSIQLPPGSELCCSTQLQAEGSGFGPHLREHGKEKALPGVFCRCPYFASCCSASQ